MRISASEVRVGNLIEIDNSLWKVLNKVHVKPGKGGAFVQLELKDIVAGTKRNDRFRSDDKVEKAHVEARTMQYLYAEGGRYYFMDTESYEQIDLSEDDLVDQIGYLMPDTEVQINFYNESPIGVELTDNVVLEIVETEAVIKGQTAAGSGKPAILETGIRISVPQFINVGDRVRVNTETGEYIERAN